MSDLLTGLLYGFICGGIVGGLLAWRWAISTLRWWQGQVVKADKAVERMMSR